jgi:hypothetical protein
MGISTVELAARQRLAARQAEHEDDDDIGPVAKRGQASDDSRWLDAGGRGVPHHRPRQRRHTRHATR